MAKKTTKKTNNKMPDEKRESIEQDQLEDQVAAAKVEAISVQDQLRARAAVMTRDTLSREVRSALFVRQLVRRYGVEESVAQETIDTILGPIESQLAKIIES